MSAKLYSSDALSQMISLKYKESINHEDAAEVFYTIKATLLHVARFCEVALDKSDDRSVRLNLSYIAMRTALLSGTAEEAAQDAFSKDSVAS